MPPWMRYDPYPKEKKSMLSILFIWTMFVSSDFCPCRRTFSNGQQFFCKFCLDCAQSLRTSFNRCGYYRLKYNWVFFLDKLDWPPGRSIASLQKRRRHPVANLESMSDARMSVLVFLALRSVLNSQMCFNLARCGLVLFRSSLSQLLPSIRCWLTSISKKTELYCLTLWTHVPMT